MRSTPRIRGDCDPSPSSYVAERRTRVCQCTELWAHKATPLTEARQSFFSFLVWCRGHREKTSAQPYSYFPQEEVRVSAADYQHAHTHTGSAHSTRVRCAGVGTRHVRSEKQNMPGSVQEEEQEQSKSRSIVLHVHMHTINQAANNILQRPHSTQRHPVLAPDVLSVFVRAAHPPPRRYVAKVPASPPAPNRARASSIKGLKRTRNSSHRGHSNNKCDKV